jgi:DNA-binding transcriptional MocR family regulator
MTLSFLHIDSAIVPVPHALHDALLPLQQYGVFIGISPVVGTFCWMQIPAHCDEKALIAACEARGASALPGQLFSQGPLGYGALRFSFSLYDEDTLYRAGQLIVATLTS